MPSRYTLSQALEESPIVAAVKNEDTLQCSLQSDCTVVFILYGDICGIGRIVKAIKEAGKLAIVHMDFIDGLSPREVAVRFIKENTGADGIISTKPMLVKYARDLGLIAIQRFFVIDSIALENVKKQIKTGSADFIEVLPALLPKVLRALSEYTSVPIIAGGLITDKEDILTALENGAAAVSSTDKHVWFM